MRHEVRMTSRAFNDLRANMRWLVDNHSVDYASEWYDGILEKIRSLSEFPESHPLARETDQTNFDLREMYYGTGRRTTHRAMFRMAGITIEVLAIRHVAQVDVDPNELT